MIAKKYCYINGTTELQPAKKLPKYKKLTNKLKNRK